jgi:RimJ/RimL family protein N-acetyltransferase
MPSSDTTASVPAEPATRAASRPSWFGWVPVRSLRPRHRERIERHLLALSSNDRYLRFGHAAGDDQVRRYVASIDFQRDEVFGIFNRRLRLIAMAHLAYDRPPQVQAQPAMAEFGVSVAQAARGRGYGARLFAHAVVHARNRGIATVFIHALSENSAMLTIARNAGASVERDGSESSAWLKLPPDTLASRFREALGTGAAEANYRLKRQAIRMAPALGIVQAVRAKVTAIGKAARD